MFNRFNRPMIPPLMEGYIYRRVSERAALISEQTMCECELGKSVQLIGIEERYRNDMIKKAQRRRP
jgi:hypothetical protein